MMTHRKPGAYYKNNFDTAAYLTNKGLAPSTRQQAKEQTTSHPVSSNIDNKRHISTKSGVVPQQQSHTPSSVAAAPLNLHGMPSKARESVKFNEERPSRIMNATEFLEKRRQKQNLIQNYTNSYHNEHYEESFSNSDTEVESFYDDCDADCDQSDQEDEIEASIENLQKGLKKIGNYVRKFKSQVDLTMSKQKHREKPKQATQKQVCPRHGRKYRDRGEGDIVQKRSDELIVKIEGMKKDCYEKIEAQLKALQNIDKLTCSIYSNHLNLKY